MEKTLGEIYGLKKDERDLESYSIHQWNLIIDKTVDELDVEDVSYLLRQRLFPEISITKGREFLEKDPFAGKEYEGELLWSLASWDPFPNDYKKMIKDIIPSIEEASKSHPFEDEDLRVGYLRTVTKLKKMMD